MRPLLTICVSIFATSTAGAALLTFDNPSDFPALLDGVTISYGLYDGLTSDVAASGSVGHWASGYGDLTNVAYGNNQLATTHAEIRLQAQPGELVRLESFDLGAWVSDRDDISVAVFDENFNAVVDYGSVDLPYRDDQSELTRTSFDTLAVGDDLRIRWEWPWVVAIDNVSFNSATIAEPALAPLAGGLLGLLSLRRRR